MNSRSMIGHAAAFFTVLVWGVTFVSTKILLRDFSPIEILFIRFLLGWLVLWLICPSRLVLEDKRLEPLFAAAGFFGVTLYFLLENVALTYSLASNVGVIVTVSPFFTALFTWLFFKGEKPGLNFITGFCMAMAGIGMISFNGAALSLNPLGDFLALLAAAAWAVYSILTRKLALAGYGSLKTTRRIFFYGLVFMLPFLFFAGFSVSAAQAMKADNLVNMLFLGVFASAICFATWTFSLNRLGAVRASIYIYLVPVVTLATAVIALNEPLRPLSLAGACLAILGLVVAESR